MKKEIAVALLFIFLPFNLNSMALNSTEAASDTSVVLQPSKTFITAAPGEKISRKFSIINRSNFTLRLKLVVKDYKQISDEGVLEFYDAEENPASSWIIPQYLEIGLKPLETKEIGFVAVVPENFTGGGHYGAILFQPVRESRSLGTDNFGQLVLLTVNNSQMEVGAVAKTMGFGTGIFQQGNPVNFAFEMENIGNAHFISEGKLSIKNWRGREIEQHNIGQLIVYPGSTKSFQWRWSDTPLMGIYKAEVLLSDQASSELKLVDGKWFVLFPWKGGLVALAAVLAIAGSVWLKKSGYFKKLAKREMVLGRLK